MNGRFDRHASGSDILHVPVMVRTGCPGVGPEARHDARAFYRAYSATIGL